MRTKICSLLLLGFRHQLAIRWHQDFLLKYFHWYSQETKAAKPLPYISSWGVTLVNFRQTKFTILWSWKYIWGLTTWPFKNLLRVKWLLLSYSFWWLQDFMFSCFLKNVKTRTRKSHDTKPKGAMMMFTEFGTNHSLKCFLKKTLCNWSLVISQFVQDKIFFFFFLLNKIAWNPDFFFCHLPLILFFFTVHSTRPSLVRKTCRLIRSDTKLM